MSSLLTPTESLIYRAGYGDGAHLPLHPPDFDNDSIGEAMSSEPNDAWDIYHDLSSQGLAVSDSTDGPMALLTMLDEDYFYVDEVTHRNTIYNVLQSQWHSGGRGYCEAPEMDFRDFESALRSQEIVSIAVIRAIDELQLATSSTQDVAVADATTPTAYEKQWDNLRESPFYDLLREFASVFPEEVPQSLP
ncbi:hypothetical protein LEN26_002889 [Aphanomyces euteiches]|nr:hypothetical protein LEN26_002889 [Aphanomyces euteiches]